MGGVWGVAMTERAEGARTDAESAPPLGLDHTVCPFTVKGTDGCGLVHWYSPCHPRPRSGRSPNTSNKPFLLSGTRPFPGRDTTRTGRAARHLADGRGDLMPGDGRLARPPPPLGRPMRPK
ncbi:hypothetical protein Shyhy02_53410 [Streptomyces hygroscopicus subsp. hygroscopicus]|nr:hypothetical protein Shyhy02_53410 [Streptomyces hygroscopicus subsp. hygroscopicus]